MKPARRIIDGGLGRAILLLVVLPVAVVSLTVSIVSTTSLNNVLIDVAEGDLAADAARAAEGVESEIRLLNRVMEVSAYSLVLELDLEKFVDGGASTADEFRQVMDTYFLGGRDMIRTARSVHLTLASDPDGVLRTIRYMFDDTGDFVSTDPMVNVVEGVSGNQSWAPVTASLRDGSAAWSDVYYSAALEQEVISFFYPVKVKNRVLAVLALDYDSEWFGNLLSRYDYGETGYAFIYSPSERILHHPFLDFGLALDDFVDPDSDTLVSEFRAGRPSGVHHYRYRGGAKYMGYQRLSTEWFLGVTVEADEVTALADASRLSTIRLISLAMIVVVLMGLLLIRLILKPLNETHRRITEALDDPSIPLDLSKIGRRSDEIGDVARAFEELHSINRATLDQLVRENREKELLAAMGDKLPEISHEVEGKLGTVITGVSFVRDSLDSSPDSSLRDGLDLAMKSVTQATRIMRSVKHTSAAQVRHQVSRFNLRSIVEDVIISLEHLGKGRQIGFELDIPLTLFLECDSGYIVQIFDNLISNSLKHGFVPGAKGTIRIEVTETEGHVDVIYSDTGKGIPADRADRVFERFYTTAPEAGGTGIGLYLVRTLVEQEMGGTIGLVESKGPGVRFHLRLNDALVSSGTGPESE